MEIAGEQQVRVDEGSPIAVVGGRLAYVDALRGLVMVLMVLDHTRDFFQDMSVDPTNVGTTTVPLFFTRWITHFCAPVFVFLAGASAYLMRALRKERGPRELAAFLAYRGAFLVALELTVVRLGWFFNWGLDGMALVVIWAIGLSMILLAMMVGCRMSSCGIGGIGALIVIGHNVLDLAGPALGSGPPGMRVMPEWLIHVLFRPGAISVTDGVTWFVGYPLLPWFGIMALGYAFGEVLVRERWTRVRTTAAIGLAASLSFVLLRAWGVYGDPNAFQDQSTTVKTVLAFLNCQKYPPSLLYVLMTLGPGLLLLAALDATEGEIALHGQHASAPRQVLVTLGRVPLFYYVLQWPVIHLLAIVVNELAGTRIPWFTFPIPYGPGSGYSLPFVYVMWAVVVATLYFPCRWYGALKRWHKDWAWLSYV
jgi:uncharacterized membrane protein